MNDSEAPLNPTLQAEVDYTSIHAPDNFLELVQIAVQLDLDEESDTLRVLSSFVSNNPVEFIEPVTPDSDLPQLVKTIDAEIGDFLQEAQPFRSLGFCNYTDIKNLSEIYNPHNLLALACVLVTQAEGLLTNDNVDILYRYRTVLMRIKDAEHVLQQLELTKATPKTKDGERTWAGDVHPYGCETGQIDPVEYYASTSLEAQRPDRPSLDNEGVIVRWVRGLD
ncbi:hypothetical protein KBD20_04845 [Candidatus Saccharibacteria bacterium]|nr:hypothetical protein [Candidatus Saccharibacteria bacterium]